MRLTTCTALLLCVAALPAAAEGVAPGEEGAEAKALLGAGRYVRTVQKYSLPKVTLTNQEGRRITSSEVFPRDATIALSFIFTTCKTICPRMSRMVSVLRQRMAGKAELVQAVSISIDAAYDTPERLRAYATKVEAGAGWQFFTGEPEDVDSVLRAFSALSQARFDHRPVTFLRAANSDDWVRLDGLFEPEDLVAELNHLRPAQASHAFSGGPVH